MTPDQAPRRRDADDGTPARTDPSSGSEVSRPGTDGEADGGDAYGGPSHVVRPRWSWSGLALLIVGGVVAGVGFTIVSVPWIVIGLAVIAAGAGAAAYGGLFYDIEGSGGEVRDGKRVVPGASAKASDPELKADIGREAADLGRERAVPGVRPTFQRPAAYALLAIATWLVVTQGLFYERTPDGRQGTYRAVAAALVIALPGIYLARVAASRAAAAVCALAGAGLVLGGLLLDHSQARSAVNEVLCGVLVLALAPAAAIDSARDRLRVRRPRSRASGG